jgi:hypothetical protein
MPDIDQLKEEAQRLIEHSRILIQRSVLLELRDSVLTARLAQLKQRTQAALVIAQRARPG